MKNTLISYIKYAGAGLIASAADNLTYFILNHTNVPDVWALTAARVVSLIVNYLLLHFAVFQQGRRKDSFPRYILLVIFSTTILYFPFVRLIPSSISSIIVLGSSVRGLSVVITV